MMNNDLATKRILEIDEELESLIYTPCECGSNLEIKIRAFGGGEHYVRQCNSCGRQKGGALKSADATSELNGRTPNTFDPTIEERFMTESQERSQRFSLLHRERTHLLYGDNTPFHSEVLEKYREAYQSLSEDIDELIHSIGVDKALLALKQQIKRIKEEKKESTENLTPVFSGEDELKTWMFNTLKNDFHIYEEVVGTHVTEGLKVRIDYVLYPKTHLVNHGFEPAPFGVEVKYLNQEKDFAHKASRGIWQSISYNDCEFSIKNKSFRLKFCLLFSNISFSNEAEILELNSDHADEKHMKWVGMLNVANHAKVGILKVTGTKERVKGWSMQFAGGVYFSHRKNKNENTYNMSNPNTINKVRVGNF